MTVASTISTEAASITDPVKFNLVLEEIHRAGFFMQSYQIFSGRGKSDHTFKDLTMVPETE